MAVAASGCQGTDGEQLFNSSTLNAGVTTNATGDFPGCVSGATLDTTRAEITFAWPNSATRMYLLRNGTQVASFNSVSTTTYIDTNLTESSTYYYTCEAYIDGNVKRGTFVVELTTASVNPPTFSGITSASALSTASVRTNWGTPSSTIPITYYKVFGNAGTAVDWSAANLATVSIGATSSTLTGLGDELPYAFGVRACSLGNVCDTNTATATLTLADGGAPTTTGVTAVTASNGNLIVTAPWTHTQGAVYSRKVYAKTGASSGNIGDYTLVRTAVATDLANPPTSITVYGVSENTTYNIIVQDTDPTGNCNNNMTIVTYTTGDLTPPVFNGLASLSLGAPADSVVTVNFTAIAREGTGDTGAASGASYYLVYTTNAAYGSTPSDSCSNGTLYGGAAISSAAYAPGAQAITLTGLTTRRTYSVCMKAQDAAGNTSTASNPQTITTLDITAPVFDGAQGISFSNETALISVSWNASPSSDKSIYKVYMWKNIASPDPGDISTFSRSATSGSYDSGATFEDGDFPYDSGDVIYTVVSACDDAGTLPGGTQNCSTVSYAAAKYVTLPDTDPPTNFDGIKPSGDQVATVQGQVTVKWYEPAWTADYYGFFVYKVNTDNSLLLLKDCPCATPTSCNAADTECVVTGLDAYRTYKFHVRAYDGVGNITTYLNPATNYASKLTADTTVPTFSSGLTMAGAPTYTLSWTAATDNQYASEPGATITYSVYRKDGSTFATSTEPYTDGTLVESTASTSFNDPNLTEGVTYYYSICALDASSNRKCDGTVRSATIADITSPVVGSFASNKTALMKKWTLSWTMSDNMSAEGDLWVDIYRTATDAASTATTADTRIVHQKGILSYADLTGTINAQKYINYLIVISDEIGNTVSSTLSVYSDNVITVSSVARSEGPTTGAKTILITGAGFSIGATNGYGTDTTVTIGGTACTDATVYSPTKMSCVTPAKTAGAYNMVLANPEGSTATLTSAYTYSDASAHICDNPGSWGASFAAGDGASVSTPWQICTPTHLDNVRSQIGGKYYKLMDNIDLDGVSFNPINQAAVLTCSSKNYFVDGNNHAIMNWTYSESGGNGAVALFGCPGSSSFSNLGLVNVNVTSNMQYTGGLAGYGTGVTFSNVFVTGSITSSDQYTGAFAGFVQTGTVTVSNSFSTATVSGTVNVGGLIGRLNSTVSIANSYFGGTATGTGGAVGGILGYTGGTIFVSNSYVTGSVTGAGNGVGGLAGQLAGAVTVTDSYVTGDVTNSGVYTGGFAGNLSSPAQISGCYATGDVSSSNGNTGGFVGYLPSSANISSSYATGDVNSTGDCAGGFVGQMLGAVATITNSYATGDVSGLGEVGGFVGNLLSGTVDQVISYSYATGTVTAADNNVGGFVGLMQTGVISNSYATGAVYSNTAGVDQFGGFVGQLYASTADHTVQITKCYATGSVTSNSSSATTFGGFCGLIGALGIAGLNSELSNNYATGAVAGGTASNYVGGFVGRSSMNAGHGGTLTIDKNYSTGAVSGTTNVGGFLGYTAADDADTFFVYSNNFWNKTTSGQTSSAGGAGNVGKTTAEMQVQTGNGIYGTAGWDFATPIWEWSAGSGVYPRLEWQ